MSIGTPNQQEKQGKKRGEKPKFQDWIDEVAWARREIAKVNESAAKKITAIKAGLSKEASEKLGK